jgi:hypothetical protein
VGPAHGGGPAPHGSAYPFDEAVGRTQPQATRIPDPLMDELRAAAVAAFEDVKPLLALSPLELVAELQARGFSLDPGVTELYRKYPEPSVLVFTGNGEDGAGRYLAGQTVAFTANQGAVTEVEVYTHSAKTIHRCVLERDLDGQLRRVMTDLIQR